MVESVTVRGWVKRAAIRFRMLIVTVRGYRFQIAAARVTINEAAADNVRDTLIDREKDGVISSVTDRVRFTEILLISDTVNVSGADKVR